MVCSLLLRKRASDEEQIFYVTFGIRHPFVIWFVRFIISKCASKACRKLKCQMNLIGPRNNSPDTRYPTVQLCVYHLTSFMIKGLFSEDRAFTSPIVKRIKVPHEKMQLHRLRWLIDCQTNKLTKYKVVVLGDSLQEATVGAPIELHQRLRAPDFVTFLVRKSIPRYSE
jgi:hypothetical protein